jgi:hypothetical protein
MPCLSSTRLALAAALLGAGLMATTAAQAFTFQEQSGKPSADQSFLYPDRGSLAAGSGQTKGFKQEDGMTTYKDGNSTFQFGHRRSFEERYNNDHMFDPLGKPPGAR